MDEAELGPELTAAWTFQRHGDRLTLKRDYADDQWHLVVTESGRSRVFTFTNLDRLVAFQSDMEAFLVRTGWSLADFTPDRRTGLERRHFPREANDRRRWWTDVHRLRTKDTVLY
jgi:hypothetical protein